MERTDLEAVLNNEQKHIIIIDDLDGARSKFKTFAKQFGY